MFPGLTVAENLRIAVRDGAGTLLLGGERLGGDLAVRVASVGGLILTTRTP